MVIGVFGFIVVLVSCIVAVFVPMVLICWLTEKPEVWRRRRLWQVAGAFGSIAWFSLFHRIMVDNWMPRSFWLFALTLITYGWLTYIMGLGLSFGFIVRTKDLEPKTSDASF